MDTTETRQIFICILPLTIEHQTFKVIHVKVKTGLLLKTDTYKNYKHKHKNSEWMIDTSQITEKNANSKNSRVSSFQELFLIKELTNQEKKVVAEWHSHRKNLRDKKKTEPKTQSTKKKGNWENSQTCREKNRVRNAEINQINKGAKEKGRELPKENFFFIFPESEGNQKKHSYVYVYIYI